MEVAGYKLSVVIAERFALDGGAMFGSVPRTLWERKIVPDEKNRIPLVSRILIFEGHGIKGAIELGNGRYWSAKEQEIYSIHYESPPLETLLPDLTHIILTHLHFDHAGGIASGTIEDPKLAFPGTKIILSRANYEHAQTPSVRERASYMKNILSALNAAGADLQLSSDGEEVLPHINVHQSHGHTRGLQWVVIGNQVAFPSDVMPTAHHLPLPYIMGYDMCAERMLTEKQLFLDRAVENSWCLVLAHDAENDAIRLTKDDKGRPQVLETVALPRYNPS